MLRPIALALCIGSAAAAFDASTGYGLTGVKKCLTANEACPASAQSVCPAAAKVTECDNPYIVPISSLAGIASALYTWSRADSTPAMTLATIPAGVSWNQFTDSDGDALEYAGTCGALGSCSNAYTKVVHVFDTDNCWPRSMAIPVIGNAESPDAQMALCANTIKHLLGSFVHRVSKLRPLCSDTPPPLGQCRTCPVAFCSACLPARGIFQHGPSPVCTCPPPAPESTNQHISLGILCTG